MNVQQVRWFARAWWAGPGRSALREVYPSYVLLLLVVLVLFGGNGLHPRTVVNFARVTPWALVVMLVFWVLMSSRAYRAALLDPGWALLRTFPLTGVSLFCVGAGFILLVESPWLVLWATGAGVFEAGIALGGSLALSYLWIGTSRIRIRFLPRVVIGRPLPVAVLGFVRTLVRRYTRATLLGIGLWLAVTTLVIAMFQRAHETLDTKREFGVIAFSLFAVVMTTTSQWLLLQEERNARWLFLSVGAGNSLIVQASVVAALVLSIGLVVLGSGLATLVAWDEGTAWPALGLPWLVHTLLSSLGFGVLGVALQRRWARATNGAQTAIRAPLSMLPLVVAAGCTTPGMGALLTLVGALIGLGLLRLEATQSRDGLEGV